MKLTKGYHIIDSENNSIIKDRSFPKKHTPVYKKIESNSPSPPLVTLQRTLGNNAFGGILQTKLKVNESGDIYEKEADRVADAVMRMPDPTLVVNAEKSKINARAYTAEHDEYVPGSTADRRLIAHELAHVERQDGSPARVGDIRIQRQESAHPESHEEVPETVQFDLRPAAAQLRGIARLCGLAALLDPAAVARNLVTQEADSEVVNPDQAVANLSEPPPAIPSTEPNPRLGRAALSAVGLCVSSFLPGFVPGEALVESPAGFSRGGINPNRIAFGLQGATESPLFGSQHLSLRSEQQLSTQRGMIFGMPTAGWRFESYSGLNIALGEWGEIEAGQMQVLAEGEYAEVETQGIGRIRLRFGPVGITYQNDHDFLALAGIHLPYTILGSDKDQGLSAALDLSIDLNRVGSSPPHLFGNVWWEGISAGLELNTGIPHQHGTPRSELPVYDLEQIVHSEIDRGEIRVCGEFRHRPSGVLLDLCGGWNASAIRTSIQNDLVHANLDIPDIPIDPAVGPYSFPTLDLKITIPF